MRELDDITIKKARIVVDTYEGCLAEAGDLLIPIKNGVISNEDIHGDLGEVILGQKPGRRTENEITVFKSVGFAVEDLVTAHLAYQRARERGVGSEFKLEG
jgi:ornithine cyclodeaminase/alanine dehydrogenase-like protein (mu-crystallin family)